MVKKEGGKDKRGGRNRGKKKRASREKQGQKIQYWLNWKISSLKKVLWGGATEKREMF